jgi:hypothetical protein
MGADSLQSPTKRHDFARDLARDPRYVRIKGSEWTRYTYEGDDVVLGEISDGSLVCCGNGPGIGSKLWYQQGSSSPVFLLTDHLGGTRASDRIIAGSCSLLIHPGRLIHSAINTGVSKIHLDRADLRLKCPSQSR